MYDILLSLHNSGATSKSRAIQIEKVSHELNINVQKIEEMANDLEKMGMLVKQTEEEGGPPTLFLTRKGIISVCSAFT